MDWHAKTIKTYDESAVKLAEYFSGIGSRTSDIERALELVGNPLSTRVVEIGCGDGRDAYEIVKRVDFFVGIDPSVGLLDIAKKKVPNANFVQADAFSYDYPKDLDVVYAFASLLHVDKSKLPLVFEKLAKAIRPGGILYISLKEKNEYTESIKSDEYGERMFYFYTPGLITEIAGPAFTKVYEDHQHFGNTDWFTIAFKKN